MKKEDLTYILEALNYGLNDCNDDLEDKSTHFNIFVNAIEIVQNELNLLGKADVRLLFFNEVYDKLLEFDKDLVKFESWVNRNC